MVTKALVLATMLRLPQWHMDTDTPEERKALLDPLAQVISEEARNPEEAAALIAQSSKETHYARLVLTGHCNKMPKGIRCDEGRAVGPFQVHKWCKEAWQHPAHTIESYRGGARCLLRGLRFGLRNCNSWIGAFAGLRGIPVCTWSRAEAYMYRQQTVLKWWRTGVVTANSE
jgi:hypothetical protein